uniref:F-box protein 16 n=1 Tax=Seriola lalandi dorsalis TaxID=1841481 RepID=A0A3B4WSH7_SERLL
MPHAPRSPTNCAKMQTKLSAWTPLNHPVANSKVFEERRILLAKWFDRWSDRQRRAVLQDFVLGCSMEQLRFLSVSVSRQLPLQAADFTCLLPRALCLYLFSFLDPRSLCRCAQVQKPDIISTWRVVHLTITLTASKTDTLRPFLTIKVSWHWKSIVELDQLWMPKCLRFSWCISFSPTPFEQGVWKRHYIQTVQGLRVTPQQTASSLQQFVIPDVTMISSRHEDLTDPALLTEEHPESTAQRVGSSLRTGFITEKQPSALPPWRDADRHPKDIRRFNYLDNLDPVQQALRTQTKSTATTCTTPKPDGGSKKTLSEANYKLRKAKSLVKPRSHSSSPP